MHGTAIVSANANNMIFFIVLYFNVRSLYGLWLLWFVFSVRIAIGAFVYSLSSVRIVFSTGIMSASKQRHLTTKSKRELSSASFDSLRSSTTFAISNIYAKAHAAGRECLGFCLKLH